MSQRKKLAILVGGGPAPGINSVIGTATIRGALAGVDVLGIRDGFEWIMRGNGILCDEARGAVRRPDPRRARPEDDRQRPRAAGTRRYVRLSDRATLRR